jgi:nitrogen fixation NifU-like protein
MVKGKTIEEAKKLGWKQVTEELDGLPAIKAHCSVLAVDCLKSAIKKFEIDKGLREPEPFNRNTVMDELKKIIYPASGEDIITLKMVKYLNIEEGIVTIELDVPKFCQYKDNIEEEIREHLGKFKEVKEIRLS